jgi:hypothetical protein
MEMNKPLIVFKRICCLLVLTLNFSILRGVAKRLPLFVLLQMCKRLLTTLGKIVTGALRVLATLWQIFYRVSEGLATPLQTPQRVLETFATSAHICQNVANTSGI